MTYEREASPRIGLTTPSGNNRVLAVVVLMVFFVYLNIGAEVGESVFKGEKYANTLRVYR